jgi:hypothetical protein
VAFSRIVAVFGLTTTRLTDAAAGALTVTAAVPLTPSAVAVIVADPAPTAVTRPVPLTVATAGALEVQVTSRPVRSAPLASRAVAVSCWVAPGASDAVGGVTVTEAVTGGAGTVTDAVPATPSIVAVIVAVPGATAVTSPVALTVATPGALDVQLAGPRPARVAPPASRAVAVSCWVAPTATVAGVGVTATLATGAGAGCATEIVAVPVTVPSAAVIVAVPAATAVTRPVALTVATPGALDVQVKVRPGRSAPPASRATAVSCRVPPSGIDAVAGVTTTEAVVAGGAGTVTAALPATPSIVAVIVAVPGPTAVTSPLGLTVATDAALDVQVVGPRPVSAVPAASRGVASSCCVAPTAIVAGVGVTATLATGAGGGAVTVIAAFPLTPSAVALIVAVPGLMAVTTPAAVTVATFGALDCQVKVRPCRSAPDASYARAASVSLAPATSERVAGVTSTRVVVGVGWGGAVTAIVTLPSTPAASAVTRAEPGAGGGGPPSRARAR